MSKEKETRADYVLSVTVVDEEDENLLNAEKVWGILQHAHAPPLR